MRVVPPSSSLVHAATSLGSSDSKKNPSPLSGGSIHSRWWWLTFSPFLPPPPPFLLLFFKCGIIIFRPDGGTIPKGRGVGSLAGPDASVIIAHI